MKNKIILAVTFFITVFFPVIPVDASTKINLEEKSSGNIYTTLYFDEGFVGAVDITFNMSGNVTVKNFKFSDKILSSRYGKKYQYNEKKNALTIRVTGGGINASHNLLNNKKELSLGTIELTSSSKENTPYKITDTNFTIVDNSWSSKKIESVINNTDFVYKVAEKKPDSSTENPKEETGDSKDHNDSDNNNDNTNSNDSDNKDDNPSNQQGSESSNQKVESPETNDTETTTTNDIQPNTENGSEKSQDKNEESSEATNENQEDSLSTDEEDSIKKEKKISEEEPSEDKNSDEKEDSTEFNWIRTIGIVLAVATIGSGIYFLAIKRKDKINIE